MPDLRTAGTRQGFMPLVRIKRWSQVTLPVELRKHFHLAEGDLLEVTWTPEGILFKPVQVQPRSDSTLAGERSPSGPGQGQPHTLDVL